MKPISSLLLTIVASLLISCSHGQNLPVGSDLNSPLATLVEAALTQYTDYMKQKRADLYGAGTEENPETRGGGYGHGHGGGGGHGHGYGAITLDPVSIISLLALGAFLINNILQLLRANQAPAPAPAPGRSFSSSFLPDMILSHIGAGGRQGDSNDGSFGQFFESVGSLYYLQPKKRNLCIKKVMCNYLGAQKLREEGPQTFKTSMFDLMLSTITPFILPEMQATDPDNDTVCKKSNRHCSDALLHDAKLTVKNKVYHEVSNLISALTMKQFLG